MLHVQPATLAYVCEREMASTLALVKHCFPHVHTVNLHIERMNTGRYFGKDAILLALRPIKIAGTDVENHFCKYEPAKE